MIHGKMFNQNLMFQIDTGAQVSCIPIKYVNKNHLAKIVPSNVGLESFNGGAIKTFGCIKTDLKIGNITLSNCIFHVVENH